MQFLVNNAELTDDGRVIIPRQIDYNAPAARGYRYSSITGKVIVKREAFSSAERLARATLMVTASAESGAMQSAALADWRSLCEAATPASPIRITTDMWSSVIDQDFVLDPNNDRPFTQAPLTPDYQWWAWAAVFVAV